MPAAIRKCRHYHHCQGDPVTPKASPNGRDGVKISHLDHQCFYFDCTDVTIRLVVYFHNIITLQRFTETGERD